MSPMTHTSSTIITNHNMVINSGGRTGEAIASPKIIEHFENPKTQVLGKCPAIGIYPYTFKSVIFEKCKNQKCKNQIYFQKCQNDPNNHFQEYLKMTLLKVSFLNMSKSKV